MRGGGTIIPLVEMGGSLEEMGRDCKLGDARQDPGGGGRGRGRRERREHKPVCGGD